MRTHGAPLVTTAGKPTTLSSTITSGRSSAKIASSRGLHILRTVDQLGPDRIDQSVELLDGRSAELGGGVPDEVLPELPGLFLGLGLGLEAHQAFLESLGLQGPGKGFLHHEHDPVAAVAQRVSDPDAIVRGPEGPFGEEDDRLAHLSRERLGGPAPERHGVGGERTRPTSPGR
jgi:hypothetical protein